MIHPIIHVAENDIRAGAFSGIHHFHTKLRAPDPASDQCRIEDHRLHKPVLGTAQRLILVRFLHSSGGISPGIEKDASVIAVYKQRKHPRQDIVQNILPLIFQVHFHIRGCLLRHFIGILRHILGLQSNKVLQDLHHQLILAEPVYKIDTCLPSAYLDHTVDHIKTCVRRHSLFHIRHRLLQGGSHSLICFFSFLHNQKLLP